MNKRTKYELSTPGYSLYTAFPMDEQIDRITNIPVCVLKYGPNRS